jgi:hypothetical protein
MSYLFNCTGYLVLHSADLNIHSPGNLFILESLFSVEAIIIYSTPAYHSFR